MMNAELEFDEDDILENPSKFGMPTFAEFRRNPEKYCGHLEDELAYIDRGSSMLSAYVRRHIYFVEGYRCSSVEQCQRVLRNMGIPEDQIDYKIELRDVGGLKCDLEIRIFSKENMRKRRKWS